MSDKRIGRPTGTTLARKDIYMDEFKALISYIDNSNQKKLTKSNAKKAFYLLFYFGFRAGEITGLKNSHIQTMAKEGVISLGNDTKTKSPREAYVSEHNVKILKEVFKEELLESEKYALVSSTTNRMTSYSKASLIKMLNNVLKKALGKQYSTHSFRAGYITTLHRANVSLPIIREIIGHKKTETTIRYITVAEKEKREAVSRIA